MDDQIRHFNAVGFCNKSPKYTHLVDFEEDAYIFLDEKVHKKYTVYNR